MEALGEQSIAIVGIAGARVHLRITVQAGPALLTLANVAVDNINAHAAVHARPRQALVVILGAVLATVATSTNARVREHVVEARCTVQTRVRRAFVDFLQASACRSIRVSCHARALVEVDTLTACAAVHARLRNTFIQIRLTVGAQVTLGARAPV